MLPGKGEHRGCGRARNQGADDGILRRSYSNAAGRRRADALARGYGGRSLETDFNGQGRGRDGKSERDSRGGQREKRKSAVRGGGGERKERRERSMTKTEVSASNCTGYKNSM
jgi:hypothetical protein